MKPGSSIVWVFVFVIIGHLSIGPRFFNISLIIRNIATFCS